MKDIGEKLKNTREKTGISIEEAAEDLNYKASLLEDIENGNYKSFKDKFVLKTIVSDYSKYLGLDVEEIIDELNKQILDLKHQLRNANENMQIFKASEKEITNLDLIKRVSQLEKIIYGKEE